MLSKRALEIKTNIKEISEEEAILLEEVEKYYQEKSGKNSEIEMNFWEKGNMRRVYIKCSWRCKNQNSKGNYFDLINKWLSDREYGKQF